MELNKEKVTNKTCSFIKNSEYIKSIRCSNQNGMTFLLSSQNDDVLQYLKGNECQQNDTSTQGCQEDCSINISQNTAINISSITPYIVEDSKENLRDLNNFDFLYKILDNCTKTKFLVVFSSDLKEKYHLEAYKSIFQFLFLLQKINCSFLNNAVFAMEYNIEENDIKIIQNDIKLNLNLIASSTFISNWNPKLVEFIKNLFERLPMNKQTKFFSTKKSQDLQKTERLEILNSLYHLQGIQKQPISVEESTNFFNIISVNLEEQLKSFEKEINDDFTNQRYEKLLIKFQNLKKINETYSIVLVKQYYNNIVNNLTKKYLYDDIKQSLLNEMESDQYSNKNFLIILNNLQSAYEHLKLIDLLKEYDLQIYEQVEKLVNLIFIQNEQQKIAQLGNQSNVTQFFIQKINLFIISYQRKLDEMWQSIQQSKEQQEIEKCYEQKQIELMVKSINYYLLYDQITDYSNNEKLSIKLYFNDKLIKKQEESFQIINNLDEKNENIKQIFVNLSFINEFEQILTNLDLDITSNKTRLKLLKSPYWCSQNLIKGIKDNLISKFNLKINHISERIQNLVYEKSKQNQTWIIQEINLTSKLLSKKLIQQQFKQLPQILQKWKSGMFNYIINKLAEEFKSSVNNLEDKFNEKLATIKDVMEDISIIVQELQLGNNPKDSQNLKNNLMQPFNDLEKVFNIILLDSKYQGQKYLGFILKYESLIKSQYISYFPYLGNLLSDFKKQYNQILEQNLSNQQSFFNQFKDSLKERIIRYNELDYNKRIQKIKYQAFKLKQRLAFINQYEKEDYNTYLEQNDMQTLSIESQQQYQETIKIVQQEIINTLFSGDYQYCEMLILLFSEIIIKVNQFEQQLINEVINEIINYFPKQNMFQNIKLKTNKQGIEFNETSSMFQYQKLYQISKIFEQIDSLICKNGINQQELFINLKENIQIKTLISLISMKEAIDQLLKQELENNHKALKINSQFNSYLEEGNFHLAEKTLLMLKQNINSNLKQNLNRNDIIRINQELKKQLGFEVNEYNGWKVLIYTLILFFVIIISLK